MPMFSESVIKQTVDAVQTLWKDPSKLEGDFQKYYWGNGHPHTVLKRPAEVEKLLRMSEQEARQNVFGIGGNGYITPRQQIDRFRWHMCISFYRWEGAAIPQEVKDKIEHLTLMEEEDAKYWAEVYETTQWDAYDQPAPAAPPAKAGKPFDIRVDLFQHALEVFVFPSVHSDLSFGCFYPLYYMKRRVECKS